MIRRPLVIVASVLLAATFGVAVYLDAAITLQQRNFASSTLASGITNSATSLTVAAGTGARFPASGPFRAVIWSKSYGSPTADLNREIINVTSRSTDTLAITRASEGTVAKAWQSGDYIAQVLTAGALDEYETTVTGQSSQLALINNSVADLSATSASQATSIALGSNGLTANWRAMPVLAVYNGVNSVRFDAGVVWHEGTTSRYLEWSSPITFVFGPAGSNPSSTALAVANWYFIYIHNESLDVGYTLAANELIANGTAPSFSASKRGWYNGNDRVIAALRTKDSAAELCRFVQADRYVLWDEYLGLVTGYDVSVTDYTITARVPVFSDRALITFEHIFNSTGTEVLKWRPAGTIGPGHRLLWVGTSGTRLLDTMPIIVNSSGTFIVNSTNSTSDHFLYVYQDGYLYPEGM